MLLVCTNAGQRHYGVAKSAFETESIVREPIANNLLAEGNVLSVYDNPIEEKQLKNDDFHEKKYWTKHMSDTKIYDDLYETCLSCERPLVIGGDHSIGQATVLGSLARSAESDEHVYVLWIDAHTDINTYDKSITKNHHGMPLAGVIGLEKPWTNVEPVLLPALLPTSRLLYFGARDIDEFEHHVVKDLNIFHTRDLEIMICKLKQIINTDPAAIFHISWDVDSLDPKYFNSTGVLANDGLKPSELVKLFRWINVNLYVTAMDIVEANWDLGNAEKSKKTFVTIINSMFDDIELEDTFDEKLLI